MALQVCVLRMRDTSKESKKQIKCAENKKAADFKQKI